MIELFAIAAVLAAGQLPAAVVTARTSAGPPVALTEEAQIRDLCSALGGRASSSDEEDPATVAAAARARVQLAEQAAGRSYRVEIPAKGFTLGRYREGQHELELDGDFPLRTIDDHLALDLAGTDDVAFNATPAEVADWTRQKKAGTLRLAIVFRASSGGCAGNPIAREWRLAGTPLSWQVLDGGGVVAAADEAGLPIVPEGAASGAQPVPQRPRSVRVERLSLDTGADVGAARLEGVQASLDRCAAGAQRAGSLVVIFAVANARVAEPQVIVDGVRDQATSDCVVQALSGATLTGGGSGSARGTAELAVQ